MNISTLRTDLIEIADAPAIPGLIFRHFRGPDDFPGMVACLNASEAANGLERAITVEELANNYSNLRNCSLPTDLMLVEVNGEVAGYIRVEWWKTDQNERVFAANTFLRPEWRRQRIGTAMLRWAEARMRAMSAAQPHPGPEFIDAFAAESSPAVVAILTQNGYQAIRYGFEMVRPDLDNIPDYPLPPGLETRPVTPEQYRAIWEADQEAFRDHWGYSPAVEGDYERWLNDKTVFMPDLWKIAWDADTNEIAGQVRSFINHEENEAFSRKRGYTEFISTRRPYRRRGVARALIALSLRVLKAHGMTEAALGVDAQNPNGAVKVYEDCGFQVVKRFTRFRKPLN